MKRVQALVAALVMTVLIGLCMLAVGVNAVFNQNTVPILDAPPSAAAASNQVDSPNQVNSQAPSQSDSLVQQYQAREKQYQDQIQQLNNLVKQYQDREKQYQTQLNQANAATQQATQTAQQLQNILAELQRRGIIRVMSDGSIQIRRGGD